MISLVPLSARIAGKFRPTRRFDWPGYPSRELFPETTLDRSVSIADEADYARILDTIEDCDLDDWIAEARGGPQVQPPTRRINLGRAMVADGTIYYGGGFEALEKGLPQLIARGRAERLSEVQMASFGLTEQFFGHWLLDGSMLLLLAEQMGVTALTPRTLAMTAWGHRAGYAEMVAVPSVKPRYAIVEQLWGIEDLGRNPGRAERLHELRARIGAAADRSQPSPSRVFLRRGLSGVPRFLRNEDAICGVLEREYGFAIVDPTTLTPQVLAGTLRDAATVMGVEGSQSFHALVSARADALLFQIMPATRFSIAHKWFGDMIGMRYGFTVADAVEDGFHLPIERLRRSMDLIARAG